MSLRFNADVNAFWAVLDFGLMKTFALVLLASVTALAQAPASATPKQLAPERPPIRNVGSMSDLMVKIIYPASDALFYIESRTPTTDAEWTTLEGQALMVAESANLLMLPGRARDQQQWLADSKLMLEAGAAAVKAVGLPMEVSPSVAAQARRACERALAALGDDQTAVLHTGLVAQLPAPTAVRALESAAALGVNDGRTELFIHGDYDFALVDRMMTNFHLPKSSLIVMIDAFVGPRWRDLYADALRDGYRFLSFGDAMLLTRR